MFGVARATNGTQELRAASLFHRCAALERSEMSQDRKCRSPLWPLIQTTRANMEYGTNIKVKLLIPKSQIKCRNRPLSSNHHDHLVINK